MSVPKLIWAHARWEASAGAASIYESLCYRCLSRHLPRIMAILFGFAKVFRGVRALAMITFGGGARRREGILKYLVHCTEVFPRLF